VLAEYHVGIRRISVEARILTWRSGSDLLEGTPLMPTIENVRSFLADENGLAVVSTTQADGRVAVFVAPDRILGNSPANGG